MYLFVCVWYWGLNSDPQACYAGALLLESCLQSFVLWFGFDRVLHFLPGKDLDQDPPISASWRAGLTSVCHHTWPSHIIFLKQWLLASKLIAAEFHLAKSRPFSQPVETFLILYAFLAVYNFSSKIKQTRTEDLCLKSNPISPHILPLTALLFKGLFHHL
jgi:hypothetical protein